MGRGRIMAAYRIGGRGTRAAAVALLAALLLLMGGAGEAGASCDIIPGTVKDFRGALGTLNRPFAIPGDVGQQLTVTLKPSACDAASPGFVDLPGGVSREDDYFVTVLFTPPNGGPRNAVVLTTLANEPTCQTRIASAQLGATCRVVLPGTQELEVLNPTTLRFRFPDTEAELAPDGDDRTFTGPAAPMKAFPGTARFVPWGRFICPPLARAPASESANSQKR